MFFFVFFLSPDSLYFERSGISKRQLDLCYSQRAASSNNADPKLRFQDDNKKKK